MGQLDERFRKGIENLKERLRNSQVMKTISVLK